jgi:glycosyltransferase involved in cell wall biosynthesis
MPASYKKSPYLKVNRGQFSDVSSRFLCVFSHFSRNKQVADYVYFYLQKLREAHCDIVFVSTSDSLPEDQLARLEALCCRVLVRKNYGYDFGSYKCGIDAAAPVLDRYEKLVLANDSCYGPFHDLNDLINHGDTQNLDMWGATDSFAVRYHIQSYFMVYNRNVVASPVFNLFWNKVKYSRDALKIKKQQIIDDFEIGGSTHFIDKSFKLGAFCDVSRLKRYIFDSVNERLHDDATLRRLLLANITVKHNPTHFYWDLLIRNMNFPFIKRELLQVNPVKIETHGWDKLITAVSDYPIELIFRHILEASELRDTKDFAWFFEPVQTPAGVDVPYFLTQLLTVWPDLSDKMGIHCDTVDGVLNAMAFWEQPQRNNCPDIAWPKDNQFPAYVYEPATGLKQDAALPISRGALAAWRTRPDLQSFDLDSYLGRQCLVFWRLSLGQQEYRFLVPTPAEIEFLQAPCRRFGDSLAHLPNLALLLPVFHAGTPRLVELLQQGDVATYEQWWAIKSPDLLALLNGFVQPAPVPEETIFHGRPFGTFNPDGINIIGLPNGQFGIGEDARTATRAMQRAGFETTVCPAPISIATMVSRDEWTDDFIKPEPVAKTNLICLPAADCFQLLLKQWAPALNGRYNICGWQWELPHWPDKWAPLLNIPDEIWAQSRFVQTMFQAATDKPVTYMPLAVDKPVFHPVSKSFFGIPEQAFTFLSVFDCNSWIKRKNPLAAIRAFDAAFPRSRSDVRLVVKIMNSRPDLAEYQELLQQAGNDPRIIVIDKFLSRNDMLALIDCCDVFVSLHRSEGFGRVIAEAMYIGKPVISTNFSGSVDFAFEQTAYTVDGPLVALQPGDYVEFENQHWMDPDVGMAADAMRRCIDDGEHTQALAAAGKLQIENNHTVFKVAVRYLNRLKALGVN